MLNTVSKEIIRNPFNFLLGVPDIIKISSAEKYPFSPDLDYTSGGKHKKMQSRRSKGEILQAALFLWKKSEQKKEKTRKQTNKQTSEETG